MPLIVTGATMEFAEKKRGKRVLDWYSSIKKSFKGKMLDHGCASGFTMDEWKKKGWDCFGIDPLDC